MNARQSLRAATADDHARVDRLFGALDLADRGDYGRFLRAQAEAHLAVEAELDRRGVQNLVADWSERRRGDALRADLRALGVEVPEPAQSPSLDSEAAILGALYVLEGSRLGGAYLRRKLTPDMPQSFLAAPQPPRSWPKLLETLDEYLYGSVRIGAATGAARAVFALFEAAGRRHVESLPA